MQESKYSVQELRDRRIGKFIAARTDGWEEKNRTYREEKVLNIYSQLRSSFRPLFTDETNYVNHNLAAHAAQILVDTFLLRRADGQDVEPPQPVAPHKIIDSDNVSTKNEKANDIGFLTNKADFGEVIAVDIDAVRDLNWIYNHIAIKDVSPDTAPSPGAYAHLKFIQSDNANMVDFFTKVYPRIIPSKSQLENINKFNDDGREHFELLERLSAECQDDTEQVPIL